MSADQAQLAASLKQAKSKPMFFAFVAKGTEGKLLVEKNKVPAKDTAQAKKDCGGGTIFQGRCLYEGDTMVFEVSKEPPGSLLALLKKVIKAEAGLTMTVAFRVNASLAEGEGGETETEEVPTAPPLAPTAPPPQPDPRAAQLVNRLNAMSAGIKTALAGPNKARVQTLFVSANAPIKKNDYDAAGKALDEMEPLTAGAPTASASAAPPSPPPPTTEHSAPSADGAAVTKRLNALSADIKTALAGPNKGAVQTRFVAVNAAIKNHDYAGANKTLDELEGLVKGARPTTNGQAQSGGEGKLSIVKLGKARIEWGQVCSKAVADIGELVEMIQGEFEDDPDQKSQLATARQRVEGLIAGLKDELGPALDNVLNAQDDAKRKPFIEHAKAMLAKFDQVVHNDPIMTKLDGNELMPEMQVRAPLQGKLHEIAAALG